MSLFSRVRDVALEKALMLFLSPLVKRYGRIGKIGIDTSRKEISGEIYLIGDVVPLELYSSQYRVEDKEGESYLVLSSFKFSKEWVQNLSDDFLREYTVKIPSVVKPLIE